MPCPSASRAIRRRLVATAGAIGATLLAGVLAAGPAGPVPSF